MNFLSHGEHSNLLEHIREVCDAAETLEERIICACHDIGKATIDWQAYIKNKGAKSPHHHAGSGGLLASLLIRELNQEKARVWSLVALHAGAAHHSFIGALIANQEEFSVISQDTQAKVFFCENIASLLPEIEPQVFINTWDAFQKIAHSDRVILKGFLTAIKCSSDERLEAFILSRSILGRLCYQDHQSAAKQSGNSTVINPWCEAFPDKNFFPRPPKVFPQSNKKIHELRTTLKERLHDCLNDEAIFYFIDAPTGLGKTETMLSAAENLVERHKLQRIVFSVPQVSIADQIFEDYFSGGDNAQIWNYIRQEKTCGSADNKVEESNFNNPALTLDIALQPFSESYNITTFNQVLLAMCHPLRTRAIRSIGLKNCVIIMDEFHKLPLTILPYFFRIAEVYARKHNCRFILGSATPLEKHPYLGIEKAIGIDASLTEPIYRNPIINDRRVYKKVGRLTVEALTEKIEDFHFDSDQNLLVVVNLISKGTWPLLKTFVGRYNPWEQLEELRRDDAERIVIFLDGLVPPKLRRKIVLECKKAMTKRPVTLITTQMVEVGVDLDFDHGIIDFQGVAATIQRGGRIGREGRTNGKPCDVEVFSLIDGNEKTSFQILCDVQTKYDARMKNPYFAELAKKTGKFWNKEMSFFQRWEAETIIKDFDFVETLRKIQSIILGKADGTHLLDDFLPFTTVARQFGVNYVTTQYIAELFGDNKDTQLLILKDQDDLDKLTLLVQKLEYGEISSSEKKTLNRFIVDHKITVSSKDVITEMGLQKIGQIQYPEEITCMSITSGIL